MNVKSRFAILSLMILLAGCATTVPGIYLKQGDLQMNLQKEAYGIESLAVSADGQYLLTADNGGWGLATGGYGSGKSALRLWDLALGRMISKIDTSHTIISTALSPDMKYAVSGGMIQDRPLSGRKAFPPLHVWDLQSGRMHKQIQPFGAAGGNEFSSVTYSRDGRYFLATDWMGVHVFDAGSAILLRSLVPEDYQPPSAMTPYRSFVATFSPDGRFVLSGGPDGIVRLWNIETGKEIRQFHGHKTSFMFGGVCSVEFSPDGRLAVTSAYSDGDVILWDLATGSEVRRITGFESVMGMYFLDRTLSFSHDGKYLFVVGDTIRDVAKGEIVTDLRYAWKGVSIAGRNPVSGQFHPNGRYVLMTMDDAAVRIYDAKSGDEVAVLIAFDDGEWLTITSEGYYNASEKGAQYLTISVGGATYGVDSFYDVFYRPDIVAAKLRGEDIKGLVTITMADAIKRPPPVVELASQLKSSDQTSVKVCYQVKNAGGGIGEVRLFHNGKLFQSDGYYKEVARSTADTTQLAALNSRAIYDDLRGLATTERMTNAPVAGQSRTDVVAECREIEPVPGENQVSISAFNGDNTVQSVMKTIGFNSTAKQEDPHLYILSIGTDLYKDRSVNLKYAAKDARDIVEKLKGQAATLYQPQNIHYELLTNVEATKASILNRIDSLAKTLRPQDGFILFVAGHGALLRNQYYIITHDYDGAIADGSMISSNEIVEASKKIRSLTQLLIFDTCHAGGVDYIVSGLYDARMSVLAKKMGLHIYASSNDKQSALDGYKGNGLFTRTLLDGLSNNRAADKYKEGRVTISGLGEYSRNRTIDISKEIGHSQTPLIINFGKDAPLYQLQ